MQTNQVIAKLYHQDIIDIPKGLFITPDALKVFLEMFEGPLDLLLYLIKKQNIDILAIPITTITDQYIEYINAMSTLNIDLAGDYLVMAATLLTIKSSFMLPRESATIDNEDNIDPIELQQQLIKRLVEYEKIKLIAIKINQLPHANRDFRWINIIQNQDNQSNPLINVAQLSKLWDKIINQPKIMTHLITKDEYSINDIMSNIIKQLKIHQQQNILQLFNFNQSLQHNIITFIAILELTKEGLVKLSINNNDIIVINNSFMSIKDGN
jgi:segregation and condensation protein A